MLLWKSPWRFREKEGLILKTVLSQPTNCQVAVATVAVATVMKIAVAPIVHSKDRLFLKAFSNLTCGQ